MKEFISQFFGGRKRDELESIHAGSEGLEDSEKAGIPEKILRRKNRISSHLDNIYRAQGRLESLQAPWFPMPKDLKRGGFAATQILFGAVAVPSGMLFRDTVGQSQGAILSYLGMQTFIKGVMAFALPVLHSKIEKKPGRKKNTKDLVDKEKVSEVSLREKIAQITAATQARQKELKDTIRGYQAAKAFISEEERGTAREKFLEKYGAYLDELIDGQADVLEPEQPVGGLVELSRTLKSSYKDFATPHQEIGDVIGTFFATGVLTGTEAQMHGSPFTFETIAALGSGVISSFGEMLERRRSKDTAQSHFETIDREIESLKDRRLEVALKLERMIARRQKKENKKNVVDQLATAPESDRQPSEATPTEDDQEIKNTLALWQEEVKKIIAGMPSDTSEERLITATAIPRSSQSLAMGALAGFLGVVIPQKITVSPQELSSRREEPVQPVVTAPRREPVVKPLDRRTLVELTALPSIDRKIVHDIVMLINQDASIIPEQVFTGDAKVVVSKLESIANDTSVTAEELEDVIDYLEQMDTTLRANESILEFRQGHLRVILENKKKIEEALEQRERNTVATVLKMMPSTMRAFLLTRYHICAIEAGEEIDEAVFEDRIRMWMQGDRVRERDRAPLRRFLEFCEKELQQLPTLYARSEKEVIVQRGLGILREHIADAPFSPARNMQYREERLSALEPIVAAYVTERDQNRIPGIGMKERLAYESTFVPSDDIHAVSFDHRREEKDVGLRSISTAAVIGSYISSAAEGSRRNWLKTHTEDPELREEKEALQVSDGLVSRDATIETFDEFFFDPQTAKERIEVWRIPGIAGYGPLFFVMKGIKYVSAAKIAGMPRIVARVREVRQPTPALPLEIVISDLARYTQLRKLKDAGFIDGDFTDRFDIGEKSSYSAKIKRQVFPWSIWFSQQKVQSLCSIYNALYPQAFDQLYSVRNEPIIKDALVKDFPTFYNYLSRRRSHSA